MVNCCFIYCISDSVENWALLASAVHSEAVLTTSTERRQGLLECELRLLQYILEQGTSKLDSDYIKASVRCVLLVYKGESLQTTLNWPYIWKKHAFKLINSNFLSVSIFLIFTLC